jgi:hypothetical protein
MPKSRRSPRKVYKSKKSPRKVYKSRRSPRKVYKSRRSPRKVYKSRRSPRKVYKSKKSPRKVYKSRRSPRKVYKSRRSPRKVYKVKAKKSGKKVIVSMKHHSYCKIEKSSKYKTRPGPPIKASNCKGEFERGNNGKMYLSAPNKNGVYRWILPRK